MSLEPAISEVVVLVGANDEAVASLQPAAEILGFFEIGTQTAVLTASEPAASVYHGVCAMIVASPNAALPAALAAHGELPVIRVPTASGDRNGLALLTDGEHHLPAGPADGVFATMAIGEAGAKNAALFVVSMLAHRHEPLRAAWKEFRARQTEAVLSHPSLTLEDSL